MPLPASLIEVGGRVVLSVPSGTIPLMTSQDAATTCVRRGFRPLHNRLRVARVSPRSMTSCHPLPSPDATDAQRGEAIMARLVARIGAPSLEDYRRAYAGCGAPWPGMRRSGGVTPSLLIPPRDRWEGPSTPPPSPHSHVGGRQRWRGLTPLAWSGSRSIYQGSR